MENEERNNITVSLWLYPGFLLKVKGDVLIFLAVQRKKIKT